MRMTKAIAALAVVAGMTLAGCGSTGSPAGGSTMASTWPLGVNASSHSRIAGFVELPVHRSMCR